MGFRGQGHKDEMFRDTSIHLDKDTHPVPVSNFLNAQCKSPVVYPTCLQLQQDPRFLGDRYRHSSPNLQGGP